ncbi:aquaporin-like protein [Lophiostoma macrostomum CBS 122681]|uniref:Aquaporin-like protein n=1 Tax=Lophiostoma macrostomum CBS 122681 TaxID=1314788 RepID=A0A6A6TD54_9PLEO|nr:aquaporin-like protein [Lophiostoma macrostomum CBS 122681]
MPQSPKRSSLKTNKVRQELRVFAGEFIGTFMFLFFAFAGTQIALESGPANPLVSAYNSAAPDVTKLLYIAFSFGVSLAVNVAIFADVSGGMFNPAVTLALCLLNRIRPLRALHSITAQLLAGISSAFFISILLPGPLPVATKLDPSFAVIQGFMLELFLTAQLVLTIVALPASNSKPMYIGAALFVAELAGVFYTGGSLNPARSLGPACVVEFKGSDWIYFVGPVLGAGMGAGVWVLLEGIKGKDE